MRYIVIGLILLLGGCADAWMTDSQKETVKATQSVVNERIASGQMTPAEGQMILAQQRSEMEDAARTRMALGMSAVGAYQRVGPNTVVRY